ncbi:MAG: hypothetical protein ACYTEU_10900, partial [Planctomycetota bacterium]|jgi:hypothetical protein
LSYYQPARPDHHGLLVLLFVISVGLALRLVLEPFKYSICYAAGAVGALSLWVSVESMIPVCLSLGVLGLLWIMNQGDYLRKAVHLGIALFIFCSINLLLERPFSDIMSIEFDRLSIVYSCLFGLIALFWVVASVFESRTPLLRNRTGRIVCCVLGGLGVALAMRLLFPAFYKGPMADVDPRIIPILFNKIKEVQPLMSNSSFLGMAVQVIGSAVVSFILLVYLFLQNAEKAKRSGWVCIAVLAVAFVSIALYQLRWAVYAQTLLCIVMTELLCRILQWRKDQGNKLMRALRNGLVTMVFAFGFLYVGVITKTLVKKDEPKENREKISLIPMCEYLNEQDRTLRILTHSNFAGEILYRTPHEVVGANYHRNGPGIIDAHKTMTAETDAEALNLIRQRGLDVVLICPASIESVFRSESEDVSTFYQRLQDDLPPDGLKKAPLPGNLAENFLMFEIDL